jgi:hypothetical protein
MAEGSSHSPAEADELGDVADEGDAIAPEVPGSAPPVGGKGVGAPTWPGVGAADRRAVEVAAPQPARRAATSTAPMSVDSVARERLVIDYPDRRGSVAEIGRGGNGLAEHGLRSACVSNGRESAISLDSGTAL